MAPFVATSFTFLIAIQVMLSSTNAFNLQIYPRHIHQRPNSPVQIKCVTEDPVTPLTNCRFRSVYKQSFNLDAGPETKSNGFKYIGEGLDKGQCGIELSTYRSNNVHDIIECQVRTEEHGWKFASAMIEIYEASTKPPYTVTPTVATVPAGTDIHVLGHTNTSLRGCSYKWVDGDWIHFDQNDHLTISNGSRDLGNGLPNGDCAVVVYNVTKSGFVVFLAFMTGTGDTSMSHMTVIVPEAPEKPELKVEQKPFREGDELKASCVIKNSRPLTNMTWYLGDDVITSVDADSTRTSTMKWSYERQSITQNITRRLTREDDGKEVVCRAGHFALPGGRLDTRMIIRVQHNEVDLTTEPSEHNEPTKRIMTSERNESSEHTEQSERTEPTERTEPSEHNEQSERTEPTERTEPSERKEQSERTEPTERTEPSKRNEPSERGEDNPTPQSKKHVSIGESNDYGHVVWLALSLGVIAVTSNLICCLVYMYRRNGDVTLPPRSRGRYESDGDVILREIA